MNSQISCWKALWLNLQLILPHALNSLNRNSKMKTYLFLKSNLHAFADSFCGICLLSGVREDSTPQWMGSGQVERPQQPPCAGLVPADLCPLWRRASTSDLPLLPPGSPWKEALCQLPWLFLAMGSIQGEQDVFYTWDLLSWSTTPLSALNIKLMENILCLLTTSLFFFSAGSPSHHQLQASKHTELLLHLASSLSQGWPLHAWLAQGVLEKARNSPHKPYNPQVAQTKYFLSHKSLSSRNAWFTSGFMFISVKSPFSSPECNTVQ